MATTVFVSPGVYTREQDFTFFASRIGLTRLGLVGLTPKGPAFEPIKITSSEAFSNRFGNPNSDFPLTYVAYRFLSQSSELTLTRVLGQVGYSGSPAWLITSDANSKYEYSSTTLCVLKSKKDPITGNFYYSGTSDLFLYNTSTILSAFTISGASGPIINATNSGVTVSLDETSDTYIVKLLGKSPRNFDGDYGFYVDSIYPHLIRQSASLGTGVTMGTVGTALTTSFNYQNGTTYRDYTDGFKNSITPMIVGQVVGSTVRDLFKIETISDGDASSNEIKVSFTNIDPSNNTFDVVVRRFYDTDATTLTSGRLENFRGCTMDRSKPNFIAKLIGSTDEVYPRQSNYITVTLANNYPQDQVPAGFRGYSIRSGTTERAPQLLYKTSYLSSDTVSKTYLGCSELAYTGLTSTIVGVKNAVQNLEVDIFKYQGADTSDVFTIKGFHMESTASSTEFITGNKSSLGGYTKPERKFTVAPAGGFDGWQPYTLPSFSDSLNDSTNLDAFKYAVDLMAPPESVDINVFSTPDINYTDELGAVNYSLDMIEERADSIYIIDSPRLSTDITKATSIEAAEALQESGIDSSYAATYWPWIQIEDPTSNKYIYISPTAEVIKNIALTDNIAYQWYAPAGLNRGQVSCIRADINLSRDDRDTLYDANINPINTIAQQGVTIQGQKTMQIEQSALDRINVRRLFLQIRRLVAAASQTLLFEPNDQTVRDQFLAKVEPILLQIQNQRGIFAYKVVVDDFNTGTEDTDRNVLTGKIQIKPTPALEFVDLTFQVLPTGANFEDF